MPKIPVYTSTVDSNRIPSGRSASAADFGGDMGLGSVSKATGQVANDATRLYQQQQERQATAFVAEQSAQLQLRQLQRLREMQTDGEDINSFSDRFIDGLTKEIDTIQDQAPNGLAKSAFKERALSLQTSLVLKANEFEATERANQQRVAMSNSLDSIANATFLDPKNYNQYKQQAAEVIESSKRILTPSEREKLASSAMEGLAVSRIRATIARNPYAALDLLEEESGVLSPNATISLFNMAENQIESLQRKAEAARNRQITLFSSDPALLAIENGANPNDPADIVARQVLELAAPDGKVTALPVTEGNISVLPKAQASMIAQQLNGIEKADQIVQEMQKLKQQYGEDYYPIALRDLKKNGLDADISFTTFMDPLSDRHVIDAMMAVKETGAKSVRKFARERAAADNKVYSDLERAVGQKLSDMLDALGAEGMTSEAAELVTRSNNMAAYFYSNSGDMETAADQATKWFSDKYSLAEVNRKKFRVPKGQDANAIEKGLFKAMRLLKPDDIAIPDIPGGKEFIFQGIKREGSFILNGNSDGFVLVNQSGIPVRAADGVSPYTISFEDALDYSEQKVITGTSPRQRRREAIEDRKRKLFEKMGGGQ